VLGGVALAPVGGTGHDVTAEKSPLRRVTTRSLRTRIARAWRGAASSEVVYECLADERRGVVR
jgi:hypothetical protein